MTQTAKHTPGPWEHNQAGLIYGQVFGEDGEAPFVADVIKDRELAAFGIMTGEEAANGALIAAAPDMLEILKEQTDAAQAVIDNWSSGNLAAAVNALEGFIESARGAIAKATA